MLVSIEAVLTERLVIIYDETEVILDLKFLFYSYLN